MLLPQLAQSTEVTSLDGFINNSAWVEEQKVDGHRLLLVSAGPDRPPTALTRNGTAYTRKLPRSLQQFRFPPGEWALDGELVGTTYYVFDLPLSPATGLATPLYQRRAALQALLKAIDHPFKLVPQAKTRDEKIALAEIALRECYEGLVLKHADAPYRSGGRTPEWLKLKFVATADVVVTGVRTDGKESVDLGLFNNGVLDPVGRASLIGKEKKDRIEVGNVLEVRYLYCGAGGRLFQPTVLRKRTDKRPDECTTQQLKHVNKEVLEAL